MKSCLIIMMTFILSNTLLAQESYPYQIGDHVGGGIIFYIDLPNNIMLISAPYDQTIKKVMWGQNGNTNAISSNDGQENTRKIIQYFVDHGKSPEKSAAYLCDISSMGGFTDWYLPSVFELQKLYDNQDRIGNFLAGDYCSSTEYGYTAAYSLHFQADSAPQFFYNKDTKDYLVRCIRKVQPQ